MARGDWRARAAKKGVMKSSFWACVFGMFARRSVRRVRTPVSDHVT